MERVGNMSTAVYLSVTDAVKVNLSNYSAHHLNSLMRLGIALPEALRGGGRPNSTFEGGSPRVTRIMLAQGERSTKT